MSASVGSDRATVEHDLLAELSAVHRFALHLARDAARAEDLVQETFLKAWTHRDQFQLGTSCRAWLFTICRNAFLKGEARTTRETPTEDAELEALGAAALHGSVQATDPTGAVFERAELDTAVQEALAKLHEEYRTAVVLVDIEDQSYAAAAGVLGVPLGTVRSRLFRGRRLLQQDLLAYAQDAGLLPAMKEPTPTLAGPIGRAGAALARHSFDLGGSMLKQATSFAVAISGLLMVPVTRVAAQEMGMMMQPGADKMKVSVQSPADGSTITRNSLRLRVATSGYHASCALAGKPNQKGQGHYHVLLDKALVNMYCTGTAAVSLQNVKPGPHTLTVVPAQNDHAEIENNAASIKIDYAPSRGVAEMTSPAVEGKPAIKIVSPKAGATVSGSFEVVVQVTNFNLSCDLFGRPDVAGYGHWHLNLDSMTGPMMGMMTMPNGFPRVHRGPEARVHPYVDRPLGWQQSCTVDADGG